jgi:hypothetical protein
VDFNQGTKGVECRGFFLGRELSRIMFAPWLPQRFGTRGGGEPANEEQKDYTKKKDLSPHGWMKTPRYSHLSTNDRSVKIVAEGTDISLRVPPVAVTRDEDNAADGRFPTAS